MSKKFCVSVSDDLYKEIQELRGKFKISKIFQAAMTKKIRAYRKNLPAITAMEEERAGLLDDLERVESNLKAYY